MGRRHYSERVNHHNRHAKERGLWNIGEAPRPQPFGVRRPLQLAVAATIQEALSAFYQVGDLPPELNLRRTNHVTLLPKQAYDTQVRRGKVSQHNLQEARTQLERRAQRYETAAVGGKVIDVSFIGGRILAMKVKSEQLEAERQDITEVLGWYGVRGLRPEGEKPALHISIAEAHKVLPLETRDLVQELVSEAAMDRVQPAGELLPLGSWQFYPRPPQPEAAAAA